MGSFKIYHINYYFYPDLQSQEDLEDIRNQCIDVSRDEEKQKDVLLHKHAHIEAACNFDPEKHELYRAGALISLED